MDAESAGRASRAPADASILLCRAACSHCSDHAEKPRMMPWLPMRLIAFCARCSTRFSFSCAFCSAKISSFEPVLLRGRLHEGELGLGLGPHRHHLLLRRAQLALRIALHLRRQLLSPRGLPAALPLTHARRQRRPHQPRARRREHPLVPCGGKVLLRPRREAADDALVADALHRLLRELLDALLLLLLRLHREDLLGRAGERDPLVLEGLLELLRRGLLHVLELGLHVSLHLLHRLARRAAGHGLRPALHLLCQLLAPRNLPVVPPVAHRRRQRGPRQPRARRRDHPLLPRGHLPHVVPRGEALHDSLVHGALDRLVSELLDALLLLLLRLHRRLLVRRARQLSPQPRQRLLLIDLRRRHLPLQLSLQLLHLGPRLLHLLTRRAGRVRALQARLRQQLRVPIGPPVHHGGGKRRPRQPRPSRSQHALLPGLLLPHVVPAGPALEDALVADALGGFSAELLDALLPVLLRLHRRLLLRRARQLGTQLLERLLLVRRRHRQLPRMVGLQLLQLVPRLLQLPPRRAGRVLALQARLHQQLRVPVGLPVHHGGGKRRPRQPRASRRQHALLPGGLLPHVVPAGPALDKALVADALGSFGAELLDALLLVFLRHCCRLLLRRARQLGTQMLERLLGLALLKRQLPLKVSLHFFHLRLILLCDRGAHLLRLSLGSLQPLRVPVGPPVLHGGRQRRPSQPRPSRSQHALLPGFLLPHVVPAGPALEDALVADALGGFGTELFDALLFVPLCLNRRLLLGRARQLGPQLLERLLGLALLKRHLPLQLSLQLL
eukprot:scaffold13947_cov66-Phaeocystis_antarctica.AAC.1